MTRRPGRLKRFGRRLRRHKLLIGTAVGAAALSPLGHRMVKSGLQRWRGTVERAHLKNWQHAMHGMEGASHPVGDEARAYWRAHSKAPKPGLMNRIRARFKTRGVRLKRPRMPRIRGGGSSLVGRMTTQRAGL